MNPASMQPFGNALLDYFRTKQESSLTLRRDDGWSTIHNISNYFRKADEFEIESVALDLCKGDILDVGAGTGIHSLFLQNRHFKVCAIDIIPQAVQIMRERGVLDVRLADIMTFRGNRFDTILMLGHGIGMVENIKGLNTFLSRVGSLVNPHGQILLTSVDVRSGNDPMAIEYLNKNKLNGRYPGEIRLQFQYKEMIGSEFGWLHIDIEELTNLARQHGCYCELIREDKERNYLARLSK
jgi:SAM-dependent methyltransferase